MMAECPKKKSNKVSKIMKCTDNPIKKGKSPINYVKQEFRRKHIYIYIYKKDRKFGIHYCQKGMETIYIKGLKENYCKVKLTLDYKKKMENLGV